ncbi:GlxA family transcriptional regulator [Coralliovum pocilloporae]|uniref:GlxA family transcriptional regulator n=1 Tax=Coralliovum pocilloporae TaxID=3066369 RepID=UPI0033072D0A
MAYYPFTFVLTPGFSSLSLSASLDVLKWANATVSTHLFCWEFLSPDGEDVASDTGISIRVDGPMEKLRQSTPRVLVVMSGAEHVNEDYEAQLIGFLRSANRHGSFVGEVDGGAGLLARSGIDRSIMALWRNTVYDQAISDLALAAETTRRFPLDRPIFACDSLPDTFTAFTEIVRTMAGDDVARQIYHRLHSDVGLKRPQTAVQPEDNPSRSARSRMVVRDAVTLMKHNIEEPWKVSEIAEELNVSTRQLERQFDRWLRVSPAQIYSRMRLEHARQLIQEGRMSLTEIALASGYKSHSNFSQAFRAYFNQRPGDVMRTG